MRGRAVFLSDGWDDNGCRPSGVQNYWVVRSVVAA